MGADITVDSVTTDSHIGGAGHIFIALKGERFDGNDFAEDFFKNGAAAILSRSVKLPEGKAAILVEDTRKALCDFAAYHLKKYRVPVVAVTGSVGKTSTKDMIAAVLSQRFVTLKTQGNFNNEIGVSLTLLNLTARHEAAVVEMGMSSLGEISRLTKIAPPNVAVITNIGTSHIGMLGSKENILRAKLEILEGLSSDGIAVFNADDEYLFSLKGKLSLNTVFYGIENTEADILAENIVLEQDRSKFTVCLKEKPFDFTINETGKHYIYNALAAVAAGAYFGINAGDMVKGVALFRSGDLRQSIKNIGGVTIIEDCYNSSAASVEAALNVLVRLGENRRTIAVLGDVLEQGGFAEREHKKIGDLAADAGISKLVTVGRDTEFTARQAMARGLSDVSSFENNPMAARHLISVIRPGDVILFKASRGMRFEEISSAVKEQLKSREGEV